MVLAETDYRLRVQIAYWHHNTAFQQKNISWQFKVSSMNLHTFNELKRVVYMRLRLLVWHNIPCDLCTPITFNWALCNFPYKAISQLPSFWYYVVFKQVVYVLLLNGVFINVPQLSVIQYWTSCTVNEARNEHFKYTSTDVTIGKEFPVYPCPLVRSAQRWW